MTILHAQKDSPTARASQTWRSSIGRSEAAVLFSNLWAILLGIPLVQTPDLDFIDLTATTLPVLAFAVGLRSSGRDQPPSPRRFGHLLAHRAELLLFVATPLLLGIALVRLIDHKAPPFESLTLALCTLALWAYGAACLLLTFPRVDTQLFDSEKLPPAQTVPTHNRRTWTLTAVFGVGAFLVGVVAPNMPGTAANPEGSSWTLLATTVAAGLSVSLSGLFLSRSLSTELSVRRKQPVWPLLLAAAIGALTYAIVAR